MQRIDVTSLNTTFADARCRIGRRIKDIRKKRRISQEKLAEATGKSREYIGYLERGERSPSFEMILTLSIALEVKPSDLIEGIPLYQNS